MPITPLDAVGKQLESAVKNQARAAQARALRESSIVRQANARLGAALNRAGKPEKRPRRAGQSKSGVYAQQRPAAAPDGYVRRSPVQALRVEPGYRKRLVKRAVGALIGALVVLGVALLLIRYLV